jgi:hypothetical protein
MPFLK